jgi:hypothetical protein
MFLTRPLLALLFVFLGICVVALFLPAPCARVYGVRDATLAGGCGTWGNYGFVSAGFNDREALLRNVTLLVTTYNVRDVQFYDWFPNYSGIFQAFAATKFVSPLDPSWFRTLDSWKDCWHGERTIRADLLRAAVKIVRDNGSRPWAYVQSQTSEFLDLAGRTPNMLDPETPAVPGMPNMPLGPYPASVDVTTFDPNCLKLSKGDARPHVDVGKVFVDAGDVIAKLVSKGDCNVGTATEFWKCVPCGVPTPTGPCNVTNPQKDRILPGYFLNAALARYQCYAWGEVVQQLGFVGIHWDTMSTICDKAAQNNGARAYVQAAQPILWKTFKLRQTFNDVMLDFGITSDPSLFGPDPDAAVLYFPYSELWAADEVSKYESLVINNSYQGAVVNMYPGGSQGCPYQCSDALQGGASFLPSCCQKPSSASACTTGQTSCDTFASLALHRYEDFRKQMMRFNVVGCGFPKGSDDRSLLGAINNEYFPAVVPFTGDLASLDAALKACT